MGSHGAGGNVYKCEHEKLNLERPQWVNKESDVSWSWKYEQAFSEVERKEKRFPEQQNIWTRLELSLSAITNCLMESVWNVIMKYSVV